MESYQEWKRGGSNDPKMNKPENITRKMSVIPEGKDKALKLLHMTSVRASYDWVIINEIL